MWPTSEGDRTPRGSEAILLAKAIDTMLGPLVDYLGSDDEVEQGAFAAVLQTGICVFDSLGIGQRIAVLHHAAHYLLTDSPFPCDSLSAAEDATVAAIYGEVRDQIEIEIDLSNASTGKPVGVGDSANAIEPAAGPPLMLWRPLVRDACCELLDDGPWSHLASHRELAKVELGEWELWVDCLASAILWDRDFEFADSFLDADPDAARRRRKVLGITEDYFVRPAPDPNHRQLNRLIHHTRRLVRSIQADRTSEIRPLEDDPIA